MKRILVTSLAIAVSSSSLADEFEDLFSEDAFEDIVIEQSNSDSILSISHELSFDSILNYNSDKADNLESLYSGISSVETTYIPTLNYAPSDTFSMNAELMFAVDSIFWLRENDGWSDEDKDARQYQFDIRQLDAQYRHNNWQYSTGIQNVTLGMADALSVANVLYAQNLAVPGTTDIDDMLKPAWTSIASGSVGAVRMKLGSVHTHELNDMPESGTDFDSGINAMLDGMGLTIKEQPLKLNNMGWFGSVSGVVDALDWQFNAVSQLAHSPAIKAGSSPEIRYPRVTTGSAAFSLASGSFLWKAETAITDGLEAQAYTGMTPGEMTRYQKFAATLGFDYDNSRYGRLIAEVQYGHIPNYSSLSLPDNDMAPQEKTVQWALVYRQTYMRDQLDLTGQIIAFDVDASGGMMQGVGLEYDWSDQFSTGVRLLNYVDGDYLFLQGAEDRDRLIASASYRF